ncbi:MAG: sugar ABC transporter ATP-binding protein [Rhizobiaceae bacterium]|nr:sugar ABC transporter ATP-binding protein [Rhizobiaceae bacterium]
MHETTGELGASTSPPLVRASGIAKSFGGARALKGVDIEITAGEVHGLVGANGAGKSTLIKILAGLVQPDAGTVEIDGHAVSLATPHAAADLGMNFIHQELAFIPSMTVLENIMLGIPKKSRFGTIDWRAIERDVRPIAKRVGITSALNANVKGLSTAENWLINICRALVRKARLIVMDEPTASLSGSEAEKLFQIVQELSNSGVAVLYVSHRLDEIEKLCDRVTIFRDGQSVAQINKDGLTRARLVEGIIGGAVESAAARTASSANNKIVLNVESLARPPMVNGVTFELHEGEVLGIAGLVGAGRSELARLIYGADRPLSGAMTFKGETYAPKSPSAAVKAGFGLVPEERRADGLVLNKSVAFNAQLSNLHNIVFSPSLPLLNFGKRRDGVEKIVRDLAIKTQSIDMAVGQLSGGNQQKVVIGRWLLRQPKVLILDEPTRGVDVGARAEIHRLVRDLALNGMAVIVISSEPDELPDLADRVLVMADGRIVRELQGDALSRNAIVAASYANIEHNRTA